MEIKIDIKDIEGDCLLGVEKKLIDIKEPLGFKNWEYDEITNENNIDYQWIRIRKTTNGFIEYLRNEFKNEYDFSLTFHKNLKKFGSVWDKIKNDSDIRELLGDIGEIIFIKYCIDHKINWSDAYQQTANKYNDKFDFCFIKQNKSHYIDIKTTTKKINELHISFDQLPCFYENENIHFVAIIINKLSQGTNICKLIEQLNIIDSNKHVEKIYDKWFDNPICNEYTITSTSNNYSINLVNDKIIPILKFKHKGNYKDGKIILSLSSEDSKLSIDKLKI